MFTVITHHAPDLDAICSVWLIKHFLPNWQEALVKFVPAGKTLDNQIPDSDPHILHVDTGLGMLDHHQSDENTCAAKKTYEYVKKSINGSKGTKSIKGSEKEWEDEALERMAEVVNFYDHFGEARLADASQDYHVFDGVNIIDGLANIFPEDNHRILEQGFVILDAVYKIMQEKVWAEKILDEEGIEFESKWGKAIACETLNDAVLKVAAKIGYIVAVRKDPKKGYVRIKGMPGTQVDFTKAYEILKKKDPDATWFLHSSKKILLNGTTKNPDMRPTSLPLGDIIEVLKKT